MPQQRSNKSQTPINSDAFNLTPDLATLADTLGVIVPVADRTEADAVATARGAAGWPVTDARPLYVFRADTDSIEIKDGSGWRGPGAYVRHQEFENTGFAVSGGYVNWDVGPLTAAGTTVNGGFASAGPLSGQITINETGYYSVAVYSVPTGNSAGNAAIFLNRNAGATILAVGTTPGAPAWDATASHPRYKFTAGDTIRFVLQTQTARTWVTRVWIDKLDN